MILQKRDDDGDGEETDDKTDEWSTKTDLNTGDFRGVIYHQSGIQRFSSAEDMKDEVKYSDKKHWNTKNKLFALVGKSLAKKDDKLFTTLKNYDAKSLDIKILPPQFDKTRYFHAMVHREFNEKKFTIYDSRLGSNRFDKVVTWYTDKARWWMKPEVNKNVNILLAETDSKSARVVMTAVED
jgi:hypothetical protein